MPNQVSALQRSDEQISASLRPSVSLFSNCGAGDHGYKMAGFDFVVLAELVAKRLRVAELNHADAATVPGDLRETWPDVVEQYRDRFGDREPWLLSACPPCQGMSSVNNRRGNAEDHEAGARDPRNLLILPIAQVANELNPRAVVVENVPAFFTRKVSHPSTGRGVSAATLLLELLLPRYVAFPFTCNLAHYGVPQNRHRAFLTFIRRDQKGLTRLLEQRRAPYPRTTHDPSQGGKPPVSIQEFLDDLKLPKLDAKTSEAAQSTAHPLHSVPVWGHHHYEMVAAIPPSSGRSAWQNDKCSNCGSVTVGNCDASCPLCDRPLLRPVVRQEDGTYRLVNGFRHSSYRRIQPDKPAPVVTTANGTIGSSSTIHPSENRVLSALECAQLQTIPASFNWSSKGARLELHVIRRMIGEAVPPKFTELHGKAIRCVLEDNWKLAPISLFDQRCQRAINKLKSPMPTSTLSSAPNAAPQPSNASANQPHPNDAQLTTSTSTFDPATSCDV